MRGRILLGGWLAAVSLGVAAAGAQTNGAAPPAGSKKLTDIERAGECADRLEDLIDKLTGLEEQARNTNQISRADCIHSRVLKLMALHEVVKGTHDRFAAPRGEDAADSVDADRARMELACARAEQVAHEAEDCTIDAPPPPKKRRVPSGRRTKKQATSEQEETASDTLPARNESNCLRQEQLAGLLAKAIELKTASESSAAELTKLAIEPLGGWRAGKCATLDDISVAVARALNLNIENAADPASYTQALREFGLPVDTLLPARPLQGKAPLLLESEVRAFFANGLAAPLPSSQPLFPD